MSEPAPRASTTASARPVRSRVHTRQRLLDAAEAVFAQKGVGGVTVDELTTAAGFSRGAFYSNFSSIEEVFHAVVEHQSRQLLDRARAAIEALDPAWSWESLDALLRPLVPDDPSWFLLQQEFAVQALRSERTRAAYAAMREGLRGEMEEIIAAALELLGRRSLLPIDQLTETVVALFLHGVGTDHHGVGSLTSETVASSVLPQVILGLSEPL